MSTGTCQFRPPFLICCNWPERGQNTEITRKQGGGLAHNYHLRIGLPPPLHPPAALSTCCLHFIDTQVARFLSQPCHPAEMMRPCPRLTLRQDSWLDHIPYRLPHTPHHPLQESLLLLYNHRWRRGQFPTCWNAVSSPHPQTGKDYCRSRLPTCPIALLSCIGKLDGALVTPHAYPGWLEEKKRLLRRSKLRLSPP
ncbi:hypothetical protein GWK47_014269 [Chionoecetes opilio]|uniref:Uncharacterized protein n=1 Tax=Chionoecetes opilio TaxID=41210 RepID=A0A8J4XTE6_CHIOP|nr:hypothetical protein GWK47_014269 [Chionoecetes opilio]